MTEITVSQIQMGCNRKFTDKELIDLYNQEMSDYDIARELGVTQSSVWYRRQKKLGLQSNFLQGYVKPRRRRKQKQ